MAKTVKIRHIGDNPLEFLATNHIQNGHFVSIGYLSDTKIALSRRYINADRDAELANKISEKPGTRFADDFTKARQGAKYQKALRGEAKTGEFEIDPVHVLKMTRYNFQWKNAARLRQDYEEQELPLEHSIRKHHGFSNFDSENWFDEDDWHVKKNSKGGWKYGGPSVYPEVAAGTRNGLGWNPIGGGDADFFEHENTHSISFRQVLSDKNIKSCELYYVSEADGVLNPFDKETFAFLKDTFGTPAVKNAVEDVLADEQAFIDDMETFSKKFNHFNWNWDHVLYFCGSTAGRNAEGGIEYEPFIWINDAVVAETFPYLDKSVIDDMIERSVTISQEDLDNWKATPRVWESKSINAKHAKLFESIIKRVSNEVKKALNEQMITDDAEYTEDEAINIIEGYGGSITISDAEFMAQGCIIDTVVAKGEELEFWAGDPTDEDDKFAEEIIIDDDLRQEIIAYIIQEF